ncbi:hypothetical protein ACFCV3_41855 [Kribbella sp. NPDC056345]|uniref:hypothetical protein n=1 Tax=Kribbella sp. NPDC056345 TaxID=3345789 RepID=UPI0035D9CFE3
MTSSVLGKTEPRLWTPPLRDLSEPGATLGHAVIAFAEMLGEPLLPWQRWWALHALELTEDGRFRFGTVLTLVARQNGKTTLLKILALTLLYLGHARLILGSAQSLDIAKESWGKAVELAQAVPELDAEISRIRRTNGDQEFALTNGARYRIAAATGRAGRGLSVDLLILDELREHTNWEAWAALSKTTSARPNALIVGISNAGSDHSLVLNSLREIALAGGDDRVGVFEWSAADGAALDDIEAWAAANPSLGYTLSADAIRMSMATDPPAVFRTEVLCQRVESLNGAIDPAQWTEGADTAAVMDDVRDRVALVLDVSPDLHHVSLLAAAERDTGAVQVEVVAAWDSPSAMRVSTEDSPSLADWVGRVNARSLGFFPTGPAAALATELKGLGFEPITGADVSVVCQEFAELVQARRLIHPGDPLLTSQVTSATRTYSGDGWRFTRPRAGGYVDAAYAAAGAAYLARNLPAPIGRPRLIVAQ